MRKKSSWKSGIWHLHSFVTEDPDLQTGVVPAALCAHNICLRLDTSLPWYLQNWSCFQTAEAHEAVMAGNLKLDITWSDVFNVTYFLFRTIKIAKELLVFLASLPEDTLLFPITSQTNAWSWRVGLRGSIEKWQPKLYCHQFRGSTESNLVLINLFHEKTWKGTGICWDVHEQRTGFWSTSWLLLADLLTEHLFMPLGLAKPIQYYLTIKMSSRVYTKYCPSTNEERQMFIL